MARNKNVMKLADHEMACLAVAIDADLNDGIIDPTKPLPSPDDIKALGDNIRESTKKTLHEIYELASAHESFVGVTMNLNYVVCMFREDNEADAIAFIKEAAAKFGDDKVHPVKNKAIVDKRYMEGEHKGSLVTLPQPYVEKAIKDLLEYYCFDYEVKEDPFHDVIEYCGNLGGREVIVMCFGGNAMLGCGLRNGVMRKTNQVSNYYKRILADLENDILAWRADHTGICKKLGGDA